MTNEDTKDCPFCGETIKAIAKKCRFCGEFLDGHSRESVWRDYIGSNIGDGSSDIAVGKDIRQTHIGDIGGSFVQAEGNILLGKSKRDEYYEIVLNWDGKTRLREIDLEERNLSELELPRIDLCKTNMRLACVCQTKSDPVDH